MASQQTFTYHDSWYASLLALAEYFRTCRPIRVRECIQCLEAIVHLSLPTRIGARTHLQLGQIYAHYTKNVDLARKNLEKALLLSRSQAGCEDVIGESSCALANIYCELGESTNAKELLYQTLDSVRHMPYWYCRILFYLAQLHSNDGAYIQAHQALASGVDYTHTAGAMYINALFLLTKGLLLIIEKRAQEANAILIRANGVIENLNVSVVRKQSLKSFLLVLQVCYCLSSGNVKGGKQYLRELQAAIQVITKCQEPDVTPRNPMDCFQWMSKDYLCAVVYIVSVLHAMQSGQHERAQLYAEKALSQVEKLKRVDGAGDDLILHAFELLLLEHDAMCRLNTGNRTLAIREIQAAGNVSTRFPRLFEKHKAQLHTLLGLYGMATNCLQAAESQFSVALQLARDTDLWTFVNLNQAIVYLRTGREQEFRASWDRISPAQLQSQSQVLKAASHLVKGLHEFYAGRHEDSKKQLRDALQLSNAEDMSRITSSALVVLGHVFLSANDCQEGLSVMTTANQLGRMTSDVVVQLWSSMLLRDAYRIRGEMAKAEEANQIYYGLVQNWIQDQSVSAQQPEHQLLMWLDGVFPSNSAAVYDQYSTTSADQQEIMYQDPNYASVHQS